MRRNGPNEYFDILIVGGGTAGWLTANLLNSLLNQAGEERFSITLVESPDTPRIGVGEATIPTLRQTLSDIGLSEAAFFARTHASFKHAIRFEGWRDGSDVYHHTFEAFDNLGGVGPHNYYGPIVEYAQRRHTDYAALWWHSHGEARQSYAHSTGVQAFLCDAHKAPRTAFDPEYTGRVNYAYHTDAERFADLLAEHGRNHRVKHLVDHVTSVDPDDRGGIGAIHTRQNGQLTADLFIDCTGFLGLLIEKTLGVGYESFSDHLLCDRAIAIPVPARQQPRPFTTCSAMNSGWMWQIDLTSRSGTGYVYSSRHISDDEAEEELRTRLGAQADGVAARRLKMRVGRRLQSWRANCVAIGLSAGFIEPLESTGIFLIEKGARLLAEYLAFGDTPEAARAAYNRELAADYESIRDFVVAHYCLSQRTDTPFWRDVQKPEHIPATLLERLELWRHYMPMPEHFARSSPLFDEQNYRAILFGMGWEVRRPAGRHLLKAPADADEGRRLLWAAAERALEELPAHRTVVDAVAAAYRPVVAAQPAPLEFRRGVQLAGCAADVERIRLSAGSVAASSEREYHPGAILPKSPWRLARPEELATLTRTEPEDLSNVIGVLQVPPSLLREMRTGAAETIEAAREAKAAGRPPEVPVHPRIVRAIELLTRVEPGSTRPLGLQVKSPGRLTITEDNNDTRRIGLHIDSFSRLPVPRRREAENRICINLGRQPRRLMFVNLRLHEVCELLDERGIPRPADDASGIARVFLRSFPDYPVVSVEIRPGEAYIAPTENLIHDGNSEDMSEPDITFTAIGRFTVHIAA